MANDARQDIPDPGLHLMKPVREHGHKPADWIVALEESLFESSQLMP
jgi:hypothetical protein